MVSYVKSLLPAIFADNKDETDTNDEEDDEDEVAKVVPSVEAASSAKVGSSEFQPSAAVSSSSNEASAAGAVTGDDATSTLESTQDGEIFIFVFIRSGCSNCEWSFDSCLSCTCNDNCFIVVLPRIEFCWIIQMISSTIFVVVHRFC